MRRILAGMTGMSAALLFAGSAYADCAFHRQQVMASSAPSEEKVAMSTHDGKPTAMESRDETVAATQKMTPAEDSSIPAGTE